ncbi:DNA polymerase [bacterium]|nr:DNA polymerase [bacterium]
MDFYTNVCRTRDKILVTGYKGNEKQQLSVAYRPNHYVPSKKGETAYRSLDGRPLEVVNLNSMGGARKFRESYQGTSGFEIHGYDKYIYTYIADKFQGDIEFDPKLIRVATLDIECESENGFPDPKLAEEKVNAITIKPFRHNAHTFGIGPWDDAPKNVKYYECVDEAQLLTEFIKYWRKSKFDIITGWNVDSFDMTYLCNRVDKLFGEGEHKKFSPWNMSDVREYRNQYGKMDVSFTLYGINIVDYLDLYRKHTFVNQESYKLDHIAHVELDKKKLDYSEYGSLHKLYQQNYPLFLEYNVKDVTLVEDLEDKLGLLELTYSMSYNAKCNYGDTFGMVKYWETIIYNFLKKQNIQTPPQKLDRSKQHQIVGAYVKEPLVGKHDWVMSFDLNSLYPHIIMQHNISPEKMIKGGARMDVNVQKMLDGDVDLSSLKESNRTVTPNGVMFTRDRQGFLPELMEQFYDERKLWKKKMIEYQIERESCKDLPRKRELDTLIKRAYNNQQVRKIALNSAYGALANQYFAFFDPNLAEAITMTGQLVIKTAEKTINKWMNNVLKTEDKDYVIAMDTDSVYITFDDLVSQVFPEDTDKGKICDFLNTIGQDKVEQVLAKGYDELADYTNAFQQKMQMGREVIADRGIWTAKKRYILNVFDNEGVRYETPKLKMMGIETAKSSTPQWVRGKLTDAFKVVMNGTEEELWDFVETARKDFRNLPVEDMASPRGCNNLQNYRDASMIYGKGTPIHVRGALLYNHQLEKKNIHKRYELIMNSDKIRFTYLTLPNPINENVISFPNVLPRELDLNKYVDYDMQFDKSFIEPLKAVIGLIGWNVEPVASLDSFFS